MRSFLAYLFNDEEDARRLCAPTVEAMCFIHDAGGRTYYRECLFSDVEEDEVRSRATSFTFLIL
ncbi:MAG: hypothetical protein LBJ90_05275 [Treponema sp.]|nr:hypothetical protein [Treponema sp.]